MKYRMGMSNPFSQGKRLPFVEFSCLYHYGNPQPQGGMVHPITWPVTWLYEPGMFPVSLEPAYWVPHSSAGQHYEVTGRTFRFLVVEPTMDKFGRAIACRAAVKGYLTNHTLTAKGYSEAWLQQGAVPPVGLARKRATLEVCLMLLCRDDPNIDGLWWIDTSTSVARIERGGFLQDRLPLPVTQLNVLPAPLGPPQVVWARRSRIF
jgi:hypothetical protein